MKIGWWDIVHPILAYLLPLYMFLKGLPMIWGPLELQPGIGFKGIALVLGAYVLFRALIMVGPHHDD